MIDHPLPFSRALEDALPSPEGLESSGGGEGSDGNQDARVFTGPR